MSLNGKKVLVTGATGFIGSHLTKKLIDSGANVRALSHYSANPSLHNLEYLLTSDLERVEVVRGDIQDPFFVMEAVKDCEIVFHLAALIAIPYSYIAPHSYVSTNVHGTLNVLEAVRRTGVSRLIHTSTSECYGTAIYTPIDEKHPLQGQSPYSASKIGADKMVESYYRSFNVPVVTLRPFNTYGPRQSARAVIPTILMQLLSQSEVVELGNIHTQRDLTYVDDTVDAFIRAAIVPSIEGETIHFGSGKAISIEELALECIKMTNSNAVVKTKDLRKRPEKSEVELLLCDASKAKCLLGWQPTVNLREGLTRVAEFVERHLHASNPNKYFI